MQLTQKLTKKDGKLMEKKYGKTAQDIVLETILEKMRAGVAPWRQNWSEILRPLPHNPKTGTQYSGINLWILLASQSATNTFITYKQAAELGGHVMKGAKALPILYAASREKENDKGEKEESFFWRYYSVFPLEMTEGLEKFMPKIPKLKIHEKIDRAEELKAKALLKGARIIDGQSPCVSKAGDSVFVKMPPIGAFENPENYYSALFHELIHWTATQDGNTKRDLVGYNDARKESYSKEELIAELGAAIILSELQIDNSMTQESTAAYCDHWLKALKGHERDLISAASMAQKAVNFLMQ